MVEATSVMFKLILLYIVMKMICWEVTQKKVTSVFILLLLDSKCVLYYAVLKYTLVK